MPSYVKVVYQDNGQVAGPRPFKQTKLVVGPAPQPESPPITTLRFLPQATLLAFPSPQDMDSIATQVNPQDVGSVSVLPIIGVADTATLNPSRTMSLEASFINQPPVPKFQDSPANPLQADVLGTSVRFRHEGAPEIPLVASDSFFQDSRGRVFPESLPEGPKPPQVYQSSDAIGPSRDLPIQDMGRSQLLPSDTMSSPNLHGRNDKFQAVSQIASQGSQSVPSNSLNMLPKGGQKFDGKSMGKGVKPVSSTARLNAFPNPVGSSSPAQDAVTAVRSFLNNRGKGI
jgi:hypothetical protein